MRQLHVVALSEDGRSVLLATSPDARRGGFRIALDAKLAAAVRGDLPRPGEDEVRDSAVTPKEIQSRLRAGETPEQIARLAGLPVSRVERFSGPVISERIRIIDGAQAAHVSRGRKGASSLPLGEAVDRALRAMPTLRPETVDWAARREHDGDWVVELRFVARARARVARWRYTPGTREVIALDAASAALGHVDSRAAEAGGAAERPLARARRAPAGKPAARAKAAGRSPGKASAKALAKAPAKPAKRAAKVAEKAPAKRAAKAPEKAPAKRAAKALAKAPAKAPAKATRRVTPVVAKAAPSKAASKRVPSKPAPPRVVRAKDKPAKAARAKPPVARTASTKPRPPRALQVVPAPETRPVAAGPAAARSRASVPAWADVLLSTSPRVGPGRDG